ncbi:zinc finger CCHC domain-containing protein 8-like [Clytia hemisphaerica]|uniref:PSP proline-rich domain-containing protein n=1 Tax=Clytia hemisphaerica TaxID=252671 RepID=A0A7M5UT27_9CNID
MTETNCDEDYLFANFDTTTKEEAMEDGGGGGGGNETATETEEEYVPAPITSKPKKSKKSKRTGGDLDEAQVNAQNKYINELEQQNLKLKSIIKRMLGPQVFSMVNDLQGDEEIDLVKKLENDIQSKPFAVVMFLNNDISTAHRKEINNIMREVSEKDAKQDVLMAHKLQPQNSAIPLKAFTTNLKGKRCNPGKNQDEEPYIVCSCQYFKSFYLDRLGVPLLEDNPNQTDVLDVPAYPQIFSKALPIVEEALNVRVKHMKQCFNCGGEHHLNECTEPRDHNRIRENRNKFASKGPPKINFNMDTDELDPRFKPFKPGVISVGLEEALGISLKEQLPPYIYKMRELGYPPAWVRPVDDDGLKVYGADGNVIENADYEEGEIKPINIPDIVEYPGFNVPPPQGVADEYEAMGAPKFNKTNADYDARRKRAQILGYFENEHGEPLAKKLKFDDSVSMEIDENTVDLVDGKPPLPLIDVTARPPSPEHDTEESNKESTAESQDEEVFADGEGGEETSGKDTATEQETEDESAVTEKEDESTDADSNGKTTRLSSSTKDIDDTTYRHWFSQAFTSSKGLTYTMYTPPPQCLQNVKMSDLPKNPVIEIDREPWKTSNVSWYFPLYGDLAAPTGTFDNIRTLLKDTNLKRKKRKPLK